ncbi:MAG: DUF4254 domain-containing protein [Gammaproteobacteria bacterium]|nr:DUF4254 domain-containing protein [Gammaproteobacteria bacterium]
MKLALKKIIQLQHDYTEHWHHQAVEFNDTDCYALIAENHRQNFQLWHEEDKARRDDMGFEYVYQAKRKIDKFNQTRNNFIEKIDGWIFEHYQPATDNCPSNSETPGMIIDRLSILALKEYHMHKQTLRDNVDAEHINSCQHKLEVIRLQLNDLGLALQELLQAIENKTRSFRRYYQFKMYNDPSLNPALYQHKVNAKN